ncbi:hypothetical protein [Clostridium estertheticum]|uniref:Lipoprotein n=1 Tax=Clostridium estertheticum TaxID=238834 RepID=A0A7Y3WTD9_9CLOT|nr:hypothetical protein [Clostridium estertheticum]NNU78072.1 hypothetical protein [Clostridium estertheticum]WBL49506.1 hypothetical protein LOR37_21920 [Clostridium estertheticum]
MYNKTKRTAIVLTILMSIFIFTGCSQNSKTALPADEQAVYNNMKTFDINVDVFDKEILKDTNVESIKVEKSTLKKYKFKGNEMTISLFITKNKCTLISFDINKKNITDKEKLQYKIEIKKILDISSKEKLVNDLPDKIFKTGKLKFGDYSLTTDLVEFGTTIQIAPTSSNAN